MYMHMYMSMHMQIHCWFTGCRFRNGPTAFQLHCGSSEGDDQTHSLECTMFQAWLRRTIPPARLPAAGRAEAVPRAVSTRGVAGLAYAGADVVVRIAVDSL